MAPAPRQRCLQEVSEAVRVTGFALEQGFADVALTCLSCSQAQQHREFAEQASPVPATPSFPAARFAACFRVHVPVSSGAAQTWVIPLISSEMSVSVCSLCCN